ncbi:MAG: hypothetical protein GIX02_14805 [Candidatus Eremiobacteraeota bacterium]|nr:hypothetical protein [Candidatus Eremiobacteraeota bacterium]
MPRCSETTSHELLRRKGIDVKPADEPQHPSIGKHDRAVATVTLSREPRGDTTIRIELLRQSAQRLIPLSEYEAESMVTELHAEGALHGAEHVRRMLAHVLVKLSEVFTEHQLVKMVVSPLTLWDGGYRVDGVQIESLQPIHLAEPPPNNAGGGGPTTFRPPTGAHHRHPS